MILQADPQHPVWPYHPSWKRGNVITSSGFFKGRAIRLMVAAAAGMAACVLPLPSADATLQSPAVTGVTVKTGGIHGGTHTVLYGRYFTGTTRVLFGTTPA